MIKRAAIFFKFLILTIFADAQEIEWQRTIGGSGIDNLSVVIQTSDGGYMIGGFSNSPISGDKNENSYGWSYWVVKLDTNSNIEWQNTISGSGYDLLKSIIQTSDGGYLLGGWSDSPISGDKTENSKGYYDYWILKLDSIGNINWQKTIGGSNTDYLYTVIQTNDGGYLLGGNSKSNISGNKTENSIGDEDYWIVKTDSVGVIQWQNTIGGTGPDAIRQVVQTSDGGYLLGGKSASVISGDKTVSSNGGYDYWIVKVGSLGDIVWQKSIGGSANDHLFSITTQNSEGGYLIGGYSTSNISGDKSENSFGGCDYWIVKIDSSGTIQWDKTIGGNSNDFLNSILNTDDGGYLVGGHSNSLLSGLKSEQSNGFDDYYILKIDSIGKIQWQNSIGGNGIDNLYSVIQTKDNGFVIGGSSGSNASYDKSENAKGNSDFWIIKITNHYNLIQGITFADNNFNQQHDFSEPSIPFLKITENNSNRFTFSQFDGFYSVAILDTGNFEVSPRYLNFYNPVPLVQTGNFTTIYQVDSLNDFAFQPIGTFNDLCLTITPTGQFRSGFNASYSLNYSNQGNTTLIPTIVFYPDTNVSFVSASIAPTTITPDSVIFILGTLTPFQYGQITITVSVDLGLPIGTLINSGAMILPIANDANPGCNSSYWEVLSTGSYDPNDILVNRSFLFDYEMTAPPDLEYIIRFQNTGNDTAFTVKILNPLDTTRLDLSTLDIVSTSHDADVRFVYHERNLEFVMNNILLPDSNINEPMSHGFVRYRIKPKTTVAVGDSIQNFSAIYFDFNSPVITNTAVTHIILPTGLATTHQNSPPAIFPNPANNKITIRLTETAQKINTVTIYNLYGQQVKNLEIAPSSSTEVDISSLAQGVYFVKINNENSFISKIVKY